MGRITLPSRLISCIRNSNPQHAYDRIDGISGRDEPVQIVICDVHDPFHCHRRGVAGVLPQRRRFLSEMLSWGNCAVAEAWQAAVSVVAFWRSIFYCGAAASECGPVLFQLVQGSPCDAAAASACATDASARCRQPCDGAARVVRRPFESEA